MERCISEMTLMGSVMPIFLFGIDPPNRQFLCMYLIVHNILQKRKWCFKGSNIRYRDTLGFILCSCFMSHFCIYPVMKLLFGTGQIVLSGLFGAGLLQKAADERRVLVLPNGLKSPAELHCG